MVIVEGEGEEGRGRLSNGGGSMSNVRPMSKCSNSLQGRRREGGRGEGGGRERGREGVGREGVVREGGRG